MINPNNITLEIPVNPATSFASTNIGGGASGTPVSGPSANGVPVFGMASKGTGLGVLRQYAQLHVCNRDGAFSLSGVKVFLENGGVPFAVEAEASVGADAVESTPKFCRLIGYNGVGNHQIVDVTMTGTRRNISVSDFAGMVRIESRDSATGALTPTESAWKFYSGGVLKATIPPGLCSANFDFKIGLGEEDDSSTIATAAAAPSGVTFSQPTSGMDALLIGDLVPGATFSVWALWELAERANGSNRIDVAVAVNIQLSS